MEVHHVEFGDPEPEEISDGDFDFDELILGRR
jgi:hypothetical protein